MHALDEIFFCENINTNKLRTLNDFINKSHTIQLNFLILKGKI